MLEEAGEETLACILATLRPSNPGDLDAAIAALARLGYVRQIEVRGDAAIEMTEEGRRSLTI